MVIVYGFTYRLSYSERMECVHDVLSSCDMANEVLPSVYEHSRERERERGIQ